MNLDQKLLNTRVKSAMAAWTAVEAAAAAAGAGLAKRADSAGARSASSIVFRLDLTI
jgi:hypothetical protein